MRIINPQIQETKISIKGNPEQDKHKWSLTKYIKINYRKPVIKRKYLMQQDFLKRRNVRYKINNNYRLLVRNNANKTAIERHFQTKERKELSAYSSIYS